MKNYATALTREQLHLIVQFICAVQDDAQKKFLATFRSNPVNLIKRADGTTQKERVLQNIKRDKIPEGFREELVARIAALSAAKQSALMEVMDRSSNTRLSPAYFPDAIATGRETEGLFDLLHRPFERVLDEPKRLLRMLGIESERETRKWYLVLRKQSHSTVRASAHCIRHSPAWAWPAFETRSKDANQNPKAVKGQAVLSDQTVYMIGATAYAKGLRFSRMEATRRPCPFSDITGNKEHIDLYGLRLGHHPSRRVNWAYPIYVYSVSPPKEATEEETWRMMEPIAREYSDGEAKDALFERSYELSGCSSPPDSNARSASIEMLGRIIERLSGDLKSEPGLTNWHLPR
ncbi:MAG: hypothetical protein AAFY38_04110 [Pseudomonadota bacterium]